MNESPMTSNHIDADKIITNDGDDESIEYCMEYIKKCPKCRNTYSVQIPKKKKTNNNNNKHTGRFCSAAWEYFDKNKNGIRICKLCQREYSNTSSTHTLMLHMQNTHPEIKVEK